MTAPDPYTILMVMPKFNSGKGTPYHFALGLPHVSAALKLIGLNVLNLNLNHHDDPIIALEQHLQGHLINAVATGGTSMDYQRVYDILVATKSKYPMITTVVGGGLISAEPEIAMEALEHADYGVIGEGELTACELFLFLEAQATGHQRTLNSAGAIRGPSYMRFFHHYLRHRDDLALIPGLIYSTDGRFLRTAPRVEIPDIDCLPYADYEGFEYDTFLDNATEGSNRGLNMNRSLPLCMSRSCTHRCTFCFHTSGKKYRTRRIENIIDELRYWIEEYGISNVEIVDELFAASHKRIYAFCDAMEPLQIQWVVGLRLKDIPYELAQRMRQAGCVQVSPGVESADNVILKSMRKGITIGEISRSLDNITRAGIRVHANMIFGDVNETSETAETTLQWAEAHPEYKLNLFFINPYPGSRIYDYAFEKGLIKDKIQHLKDGCPCLNFSKMSEGEYNHVKDVRIPQVIHTYIEKAPVLAKAHVTKIYPTTGQVDLTGACPSCNKPIQHLKVDLFCATPIFYKFCPQCQKYYTLLCPETVQTVVKDNLAALIKTHNPIAIWGMTHSIKLHRIKTDIFDRPEVYFVEDGLKTYSLSLNDYTVHSNSIVAEQKIPTVVMVPFMSYHNILRTIEKKALPVKQYLFINELVIPQVDTLRSISSGSHS